MGCQWANINNVSGLAFSELSSFWKQLIAMAENRSPKGQVSLPLSRVKTIMKSSPEVSNIGQDSLLLIAKSAVSQTKESAMAKQPLLSDNEG